MDLSKAEFHPGGYDMFFATQTVWKKCAEQIPECLRIGLWCWDHWMGQFIKLQPGCVDFTSQKLMFHPLLSQLYSSKGAFNEYQKEISEWHRKASIDDPIMTAKV
jgi:hypothetical protein